ncbi:MAG: hypothetical protein WAV20_23300 [Blastocatellia bacterium]
MSSKRGSEENEWSTQPMLCPCCGGATSRGARECFCGARFVGEPLDDPPIKVQRLGPAITSVALLVLVVVGVLVATKWLAFASVAVFWSAWRAVRRSKQDPEWYGGYKTAAATLTIAIAGSAVVAAYGIAHIPKALENYRLRQIAATHASMYQVATLLEEYKRVTRSYPRTPQEFKKAVGNSLPTDYWDGTIKYQSTFEPRADRIKLIGPPDNFELRSAGPDGLSDTDDDIIMRDGILLTYSDLKKQPVAQQLH